VSQQRVAPTGKALSTNTKHPGAPNRRRKGSTSLKKTHPKTALTVLTALILLTLGLMGLLASQGKNAFEPKLALDLEGGTQMILAPKTTGNQAINQDQLNQAVEIIRQRVDGAGVSEAEITTQNGRNVVVSLPETPSAKTRALIQASANMEFRPVLEVGSPAKAAKPTADSAIKNPTAKPTNASDLNWITKDVRKAFEAKDCTKPDPADANKVNDPAKPVVACEYQGAQSAKYILGPVELTGADIKTASAGQAQGTNGVNTGQWVVNLEFNDQGTKTFKSVTERLTKLNTGVRGQFAILLDGAIVSAPMSQAVITDGKSQISGSFTEDSSKALAEQLRYGALPISFSIESEQQISATLGKSQLQMGIIAGLIGLLLVAIYSFFQYRLLAFVTIGSLVVAGVLTYLAIAVLGVTANYRLSLAGVAGIIVAIGLTADSFIVYFERIRDELREGRPLESAVEIGWGRAKRTILASKAVNLLAAVVLFIAAVGNVRGFAFTLGLTALADLLVVFLFTHPVLELLSRTAFFREGHPASGLDPRALGAVPLYRGAGRLRETVPAGAASSSPSGSHAAGEAPAASESVSASEAPVADSLDTTGMTIAERRAAERARARRAAQEGTE
jgi:preprotein translocase subunit SecD